MRDKRTPKDVCGEAILVASATRCRGLLLISFAKKNQEKPLGPGYTESKNS